MNQQMEVQDAGATVADFDAFIPAWQAFSRLFAKTAHIKGDVGSFLARYGDFDDDPTQAAFLDGCRATNACAVELGSVAPQTGIFSAIVQLAQRVESTAAAYAAVLSGLGGMQDADSLKQALAGSDGLVPMLVEIKAMTMELAPRISRVKEELIAASQAIGRTNLLNVANQALGYLQSRMGRKDGEALAAEYERKQQFLSDVDNIFSAGTAAVLALAAVENQVGRIGKAAGDARSLLMSVCTSANPGQLSDPAWVAKALGMPGALGLWTQLNRDAQEFCAQL